MRTQSRLLILGILASLTCIGCARTPAVTPAPSPSHPTTWADITLDGDLNDWQNTARVVADAHWMHFRLEPPGPPHTLQSATTTTLIGLDLDQDLDTGSRSPLRGCELLIEISPIDEGKDAGYGVRVRSFDPAGKSTNLGHAAVGFQFAPTYAADQYEARIDRTLIEDLRAPRPVRVQLALDEPGDGGPFIWRTTLVDLPPAAAEADWQGATIPARRASDLRVVSWNVLKGSPNKSPEPFARVLRTLDADVVLVQEWDHTDSAALAAWFNEHLAGPWQAHTNASSGVGIAFRPRADQVLTPLIDRIKMGSGHPTRLAAALIETAAGPVLVGSTHLKCCGSDDSKEEHRRRREAGAIAAFLRTATEQHNPTTIILAGDLNLVGTRKPLDILAAHTDTDGSDLLIADPRVLGDAAYYTWTEDASRFSPGRLDWVLVGDAHTAIARSFVVDARRLSEAARTIAGLEPTDTSTSDHLPVVVDLRLKSR